MPTKKPTRPERPRRPGAGPTLNDRPSASGPIRPASTGPASPRPNPNREKEPATRNLREVRENLGWGLVIGLPIILVILAILYRATNGFQGNPANQPLPTIAPTVTAGSFLAPPALPAGTKNNRILYFQAAGPGKLMQLFSADPDGSNPTQLTNSAETKGTPVWSSDGKQVAFTADGVGIQVVNFDGSGLHTVAYGGFSPVWSPDGSKIAFLKQEPSSDGSSPDSTGLARFLYVTNANSKAGDEKQLVRDALGPNWSPDSKDIAFFSLRNAVMFTIPATGGNATQIQTGGLGGWFPTFAPDGNSLVFYGSKNAQSFVKTLDQGALTPQPNVPAQPSATATTAAPATTAAGTPGATIAPTPTPAPPAVTGLYQVNRDGSNLKQLLEIENPPANLAPAAARFGTYIQNSAEGAAILSARPSLRVAPVWSSDGKQVASLLAGAGRDTAGFAIVPADGSAAINVISSQNGLEDGTRNSPAFSKDGSKVYYWYQGTAKDSLKQIRVFDLGSKKETTVISTGDNSFPDCCGFRR